MKIHSRTYYGLLGALHLAREYGNGPIRASGIAQHFGIPVRYMELTMGELRAAGLVNSRRGVEGGFMLARSPEQISALDVFLTLEGSMELFQCDDLNLPGCPLEKFLHLFRDQMHAFLADWSLMDLLQRFNAGESHLGAGI